MNRSEIEAEEQKAVALEESGSEAAALEIWLRLAQARPMAGFYCHAGGLLKELRRYEEAESAFRSARELDPKMPLASIGLAGTLIEEEKFAEAVDALDAVGTIIAHDEKLLAHELRGLALMNLKRDAEALQSFREVIALDPRYDEAFYNIGWILKASDKPSAKSAFMKVIELDDKHPGAHRELGWILTTSKQFDLAEQHLRRAVELNSEDSWARVYLGSLLWAKGEFTAAEDAFWIAYNHAPNEWYPNWELACFYEDGGDQERAARFYHKALLASPEELVLLFHYGRFLLRQGDPGSAEKYLRRACELYPDYDEARQLLRELAGESRTEPI